MMMIIEASQKLFEKVKKNLEKLQNF